MTSTDILYNPDVPENFNDSLAETQQDFLTNFQELYRVFAINHVPLDTASIAGNHTIIELLQQGNDFQTDLSELSIYAKNVTSTTDQIFLRYQGEGQIIQYTAYQIYSINSTTFFSFLPGNILVYFGSFNTSNNNIFNLYPGICKNIIFDSFCPSGTNPDYKPYVSLIKNDSGFYTQIKLFPAIPIRFPLPANLNYFIMGNLS